MCLRVCLYSHGSALCYVLIKQQRLYSYGAIVCLYSSVAARVYMLTEQQCVYILKE